MCTIKHLCPHLNTHTFSSQLLYQYSLCINALLITTLHVSLPMCAPLQNIKSYNMQSIWVLGPQWKVCSSANDPTLLSQCNALQRVRNCSAFPVKGSLCIAGCTIPILFPLQIALPFESSAECTAPLRVHTVGEISSDLYRTKNLMPKLNITDSTSMFS